MRERSPEFATSVTYLIPISAIFWGYFLLKEPISLHMIMGLLVILCGVYLTTRPKLTFRFFRKATLKNAVDLEEQTKE